MSSPINEPFKLFDDGKLLNTPDEELRRLHKVCVNCHAHAPAKAEQLATLIENELVSRDKKRLHQEMVAEQQRLHQEAIKETQRLHNEASQEGSLRHKQTQRVAWYAVWIAFAGLVVTALAYLYPLSKAVGKAPQSALHPTNTSTPGSPPAISTNVVLINSLSNTSSPPQAPKK